MKKSCIKSKHWGWGWGAEEPKWLTVFACVSGGVALRAVRGRDVSAGRWSIFSTATLSPASRAASHRGSPASSAAAAAGALRKMTRQLVYRPPWDKEIAVFG